MSREISRTEEGQNVRAWEPQCRQAVADVEPNPTFSCIPERGRDLPGPPQLMCELGLELRGLFFSRGTDILAVLTLRFGTCGVRRACVSLCACACVLTCLIGL